jgi:hypothetical protein
MATRKVALTIAGIAWACACPSAEAAELNYGSVAALSCKDYIETYGTESVNSLVQPIATYLDQAFPDKGHVKSTSLADLVAIECRLREDYRLGAAVDELVQQIRMGRLPALPPAESQDPRSEAQRNAFKQWLRHKGPRPQFK